MDINKEFFKELLSDSLEGILQELNNNGYSEDMFDIEIKFKSDYYEFQDTRRNNGK